MPGMLAALVQNESNQADCQFQDRKSSKKSQSKTGKFTEKNPDAMCMFPKAGRKVYARPRPQE